MIAWCYQKMMFQYSSEKMGVADKCLRLISYLTILAAQILLAHWGGVYF